MAQFSRLVPVCGTPAFLDCYQSQAATTTGRIITDKCSTLRRHLSCAEELIQRLFMFSGLKESDATRQDCTTTTLFDDNVHCFRLHCCAAVNNYILIALNLILCQIRQTTWSLLMCSFSLFFSSSEISTAGILNYCMQFDLEPMYTNKDYNSAH